MIRQDFEAIFCTLYEEMVAYLSKRHGADNAQDILHQTLANILEHKTYRHGPKRHARRWIFYKIAREEARLRQKKQVRIPIIEDTDWIQEQIEKGEI